MNRADLPTVMLSRSHIKPTIEIYYEGDVVGFIDVEPKGTNRATLRISAPLFLRFVRAEIDQDRKDQILSSEVPRGTKRG